MDDPTLSGFADANSSAQDNIVGYGGYARRRYGGYNGQEGSPINPMQGLLGILGGQNQGQNLGGNFGGNNPQQQLLMNVLKQQALPPAPQLQMPRPVHPGIPGMTGGYGAARPSGGWSGGQMPSIGGYTSDAPLSAPLQALIGAHLRRMLSGQGQGPSPPKANFAALLASQGQPQSPYGPMGQPQQATPAPFGQPAQFGGQGPPGGGMRPLTLNSPG